MVQTGFSTLFSYWFKKTPIFMTESPLIRRPIQHWTRRGWIPFNFFPRSRHIYCSQRSRPSTGSAETAFLLHIKNRFFHPPCPDCGRELVLCKNDSILKEAGLDSFHTSLNRYLFCPECYKSNSTHFFYTYAGQTDDPAGVLDRHGLIKRFSKIKTAVPKGFPCVDCPEHSVCYLTGKKALSRIEFFSFYPFYMLVFNACRINGRQFLRSLSMPRKPARQNQSFCHSAQTHRTYPLMPHLNTCSRVIPDSGLKFYS